MAHFLEVGVGCIDWQSSDDATELGTNLAAAAASSLQKPKVTFALVLATERYSNPSRDVPFFKEFLSGVLAGLRGIQDEHFVLAGGSVACAMTRDTLVHEGAVLAVFSGDALLGRAGIGHRPLKDPKKAVQEAIRGFRTDISTGRSKGGFLMVFLPGFANPAFADPEQSASTLGIYEDYAIHRALKSAVEYRYPIFGCSTADSFRRRVGYQFLNADVFQSSLCVVFLETELKFGTAMAHGFQESEQRFRIDKVVGGRTGRVIKMLGGKPPSEVLHEVTSGVEDKVEVAFGVRQLGGESTIVFPVQTYGDGSIVVSRPVEEGAVLSVMSVTPEQMIQTASFIATQSVRRGKITKPAIIIDFSCAGRYEIYKRVQGSIDNTLPAMRTDIPDVPVMGGFVFGEHGVDVEGNTVPGNYMVSCLAFGDELCPEAEYIRKLTCLNETSSKLLTVEKESEVIDNVLDKVMELGYAGAMLSLVNRETRTVRAVAARGDHWKRLVNITIREMDVPEETMDILPLVVQTGKPHLVPDSRQDPHCNKEAIRIGRIVSQLVVPIFDRESAIGTLQVGWEERGALTEEDLGLLLAFASEAAFHIRRCRNIYNSRQVDRIVFKALDIHSTQESFTFLIAETVKLLKAYTGHIRLADDKKRELYMIAGIGEYYEFAKKERRVIPWSSLGGSATAFREKRAIVVNDSDTDSVSLDLRKKYANSSIGIALERLKSYVLFPFRAGDKFLGTFNVESNVKDFFSDEKLRIIELVAGRLMTILSSCTLYNKLQKALVKSEEQKYSMAEAARLNAAAEVASVVSHQINNFLSNVNLICTELSQASRIRNSPSLQKDISKAKDQIVSASDFVKKIYALTRADEGGLENVDLNEVIKSTFDLFSHRFKTLNIFWDLELARCPRILANPMRLTEIFSNLILNAVDAIGRSGRIVVSSNYNKEASKVRIAFKDNGRGIARRDLKYVFDMFFTKKRAGKKGTGLGLFRTKTIVKDMKGNIRVKSKEMKGTTFIIELRVEV